MNAGNPAPYQIRNFNNNICLRAPGGTINITDKWRCDNYLTDETWFYTKDKKLISANNGKAACFENRSGGAMYTCDAGQGHTWTYYPQWKQLKPDSSPGLCLDLGEHKGGARDVQIYGCNNGGNQTIEINEKSDPDHYGKAQCKRTDQHKWLGINNPIPYVGGNIEPSRDAKAECCKKSNLDATSAQCGYNYCLDSQACNTFYDTDWCTDHPTSTECKNRASVTDRRKADWCALDPNRLLNDPECRAVCDKRTDDVHVQCEDAAVKLCNSNPNIPQCACLNQRKAGANDPDYKSFTAGLATSRIPSLGDPECWLPKCAGHSETFSQLFRRLTSDKGLNCPACIQNMVVNNVATEGGGVKIDQACNKDAPKPVSPSPSASGDKTPSPSPSPSVDSPSPSPSASVDPISPASSNNLWSKTNSFVNDPKNRNIMIGIGVGIFVFILFIFFMMK